MIAPPCDSGERLTLPFSRHGGLYVWRVVVRNDSIVSPPARAMAIHASRSRHHIDVMSPQDATACLHRRLHIGASKL
eukprot:4905201-Pleurochrysis_carterae.AAC.1